MVNSNKPEISVFGLGYVGLTLALVLSENGFKVRGVEVSDDIITKIKTGRAHFYENGLNDLLAAQLENGFSCVCGISDNKSSVYIIAVGTRVDENNQPDFRELRSSSENIGQVLKIGDLVILRSTVPIGVTRNFVIPILEKLSGLKAGEDFYISFAPERTAEGAALEELKTLPQIVGGLNRLSCEKTIEVFSTFTPNIVIVSSLEGAEMVKMVNNTYRDLNFAFANELSLICSRFNLDTNQIINAANSGYRRSHMPLPSPGVGGYCLTKDPFLLVYSSEQKGYSPRLPKIGREINYSMPRFVASRIMDFINKYYKTNEDIKISILGFAFKGNPPTSDVRFSPTIDLIEILKKEKINLDLNCHDFLVEEDVIKKRGVKYVRDVNGVFSGSSVVVVMTNHPDYVNLPIVSLAETMKKPSLLFDTWNIFDKELVGQNNQIYYSNLGYLNF
ncbi:nucleotide sugar dehydrogenase [Candidatus Wolfebacteria bacterium]|nr:nucleotide sugar dehydrogenase [Candidatus Wolfebacteria bacterium]